MKWNHMIYLSWAANVSRNILVLRIGSEPLTKVYIYSDKSFATYFFLSYIGTALDRMCAFSLSVSVEQRTATYIKKNNMATGWICVNIRVYVWNSIDTYFSERLPQNVFRFQANKSTDKRIIKVTKANSFSRHCRTFDQNLLIIKKYRL